MEVKFNKVSQQIFFLRLKIKQKFYFIYLEIKLIIIRIDVLFVKQQHFKFFILEVSFPLKNPSSCYHGTIMWLQTF